jgi:hypothetical protein
LVATAATSVARVIGKAVRDGKRCYYIDDSVYHTFSGIIFDHCQYHLSAFKKGKTEGMRGIWPDVRCVGHDIVVGAVAGSADRGPCVFGEHWGVQQRVGDMVQWVSAREGGAREPLAGRGKAKGVADYDCSSVNPHACNPVQPVPCWLGGVCNSSTAVASMNEYITR